MSSQHPIKTLVKLSNKAEVALITVETSSSLVNACRCVIIDNMDRYPPSAFGILDEMEWESIIRLRHKQTRPSKGTGGLDGSGRMVPAVPSKLMSEIEEALPHLAESEAIDKLVWKDCVEHRFKKGGIGRPRELLFPWPYLVERIQNFGNILMSRVKGDRRDKFDREFWDAVTNLQEAPMNVALLKSSGIGALTKKFLKHFRKLYPDGIEGKSLEAILDSTLQRWVDIAQKSGVMMNNGKGAKSKQASASNAQQDSERDLATAEKCHSWRQLFAALSMYGKQRTSDQGVRMREKRQKLNQIRPQVVKVRSSQNRHNAILGRSGQKRFGGSSSSSSTSGVSKMNQLRAEATVTSQRRQMAGAIKPVRMVAASQTASGGGFGAAVAFVATSKATKKRQGAATSLTLTNGKRMKVPNNKRSSQHTSQLKKRLGMLKKPPR